MMFSMYGEQQKTSSRSSILFYRWLMTLFLICSNLVKTKFPVRTPISFYLPLTWVIYLIQNQCTMFWAKSERNTFPLECRGWDSVPGKVWFYPQVKVGRCQTHSTEAIMAFGYSQNPGHTLRPGFV
jgi:hypothetical protein